MSAQIGKRGGREGKGREGEREMGHVFFPFTLCVPRLRASGPYFGGSGARYMFGVLFVKREQVLVR